MLPAPDSASQLRRELDEARVRLAETEDALDAIRNGEVDGLVMAGPEGERIFTLMGAQEPYRLLIEQMSEGALTLSRDGFILYANQTLARLLQTPLERVIGSELRAFVASAEQPALARLIEAAWAGSSRGEVSVRAADGSSIPVRMGLSPLQLEAETLVCVVASDLTEERKKEEQLRLLHADLEQRVEERTADLAASRLAALNMMEDAVEARLAAEATTRELKQEVGERRRAEVALTRQKDLYEVLSQTNQTIVRGASREELFAAVCRIAVEHGRFRFAWIGVIDDNDQRLKPVARYGEDAGYIAALEVLEDAAGAARRSLTGRTLLSHTHVIGNDFLNDPSAAPWHAAATRAGVRAAAKFPIGQGGAVIGAINLYAGESGFFTADLVATLDDMASDISFALDNFERETARERMEKDLRAAEEQFRGLVEQTIAGIYIIQDGKFAYVNPRFAEIRGYAAADELIGRDTLSLIAEKDRSTVAENNRRLLDGAARSISYSFTALCKDGASVEVGVHGSRATYRGRPAVIGLMQDISEKARAEKQIQRYVEQLKTAFMSTVEVATTLSEMRDPYTAGHERRVGKIAVAIGAELGFDASRQEGLRVAGYLHDIGKITIPAEILSKPGKLTTVELLLIQGHAQASYDVLKDVEFPWPVAEVARQHHERVDGSGYPQGLKGEEILIEARILAVADVVEAMSSHRPYRAGLGTEAALAEIERGRGSAYDPTVADACLKLFRERNYAIPD